MTSELEKSEGERIKESKLIQILIEPFYTIQLGVITYKFSRNELLSIHNAIGQALHSNKETH